jgi:hemoglobin-like flavoprotein
MSRVRKKTWDQKVKLVNDSFKRSSTHIFFAQDFYTNLFFLNPKIKEYFKDTDFEHQHKALMHGMEFLMGFLENTDEHSRKQVLRIAHSHSKQGIGIHPHHYYYWIEALIMTASKADHDWYDDLEYYWREVVNMPVSFIISQYYNSETP